MMKNHTKFLTKTIEQLEKEYWPPAIGETFLITRCTELRKKKLQDFTIEDLRIMIGQSIGLKYLVPIAIEKLIENPMVSGDFYAGDLLQYVLKVKPEFWKENKYYWQAINEIIKDIRYELNENKIETTLFDQSLNPKKFPIEIFEMNETLKAKIILLRKRIPVGFMHGLELLKITKGDIIEAETLFFEETIKKTIEQTGFSKEIILPHLIKNNFDIENARKSIENEQFTVTEKILRIYKNKKIAIANIALAIEEKEQFNRVIWLVYDEIKWYPNEILCVVLLVEWDRYRHWKGNDNALFHYFDEVLNHLEINLNLPEIAQTLRKAKEIYESQKESQDEIIKNEGMVSSTSEFDSQFDLFDIQIPLIYEALYNFIEKNIKFFP
jgi:CDI immunity proteins